MTLWRFLPTLKRLEPLPVKMARRQNSDFRFIFLRWFSIISKMSFRRASLMSDIFLGHGIFRSVIDFYFLRLVQRICRPNVVGDMRRSRWGKLPAIWADRLQTHDGNSTGADVIYNTARFLLLFRQDGGAGGPAE